MEPPRMNRFFAADGRCFNVAIDHGFFGETAFLNGIEDAQAAVDTVSAAGPDAMQLSPGQAPLLQSQPGPDKPALVLRTDIANIYGQDLPDVLFSHLIEDAVGTAVRLDAAALCVNLFDLEGRPEIHEACVVNVTRLVADAKAAGMPVMVEPLVMRQSDRGYTSNGDTDRIRTLVRQAVELGADVIKADPTDDPAEYHRVIEAAGRVPVLVRGGGRVDDQTLLERTFAVMQQGARGIVYGRNVVQHPNPRGITQALMAVVHDGASPDDAAHVLDASQ